MKRTFLMVVLVGILTAGCAAPPTPTPPPAAGVVLQKILTDCWGVTQIKELDGNRADQKLAFPCARTRLLELVQNYPDAAEPHRVLAWGYFYYLQDEAAAVAEYERAAEIYGRQGARADQADMLTRVGQVLIQDDRQSGCGYFARASLLDPQNTKITALLDNFKCSIQPTPASTLTPAL